jgi:GntR family transcriptional regulator
MDHAVLRAAPDLRDHGELPSHARIAQWLEHLITTHELRPGDKLPSEVDLARGLGVSRMTLRQALSNLEAKGLLVRKRGRWGGNFVAEPRIHLELSGLPGFTEQMHRAHLQAGARIIEAETRRPSTQVRQALRLKRGMDVHEVRRIRSANEEPIAIEESYFPADAFTDLLEQDLTASLYAVMETVYQRPARSAVEILEPVLATPQQADLLGIDPGAPMMLVTRTAYGQDGVPVEYALDYLRADRTRLTVRTEADRPPSTQIQTRD